MGLARVFDHHQTKACGQVQDRIHVHSLSVEVHRNDGSDGPAAAPADQFTRFVFLALLLQILPQLFRVHVISPLVDVDELRKSSSLRNGFRGGDESVRYSHDHVARFYATRHDGKAQGIGPAADGDRVFGTAECGK